MERVALLVNPEYLEKCSKTGELDETIQVSRIWLSLDQQFLSSHDDLQTLEQLVGNTFVGMTACPIMSIA